MTEGNRIYLVCNAHPDVEHGIMLGMRRGSEFFKGPMGQHLNDWFDTHAKCLTEPDHYRIAYAQPLNHDIDPYVDPATNLKAAVKLALVKS